MPFTAKLGAVHASVIVAVRGGDGVRDSVRHRVHLRAQYSLAALTSSPVVLFTQSIRDFFHVSHPSGRHFSKNMASKSRSDTAGSPSISLAPGLLASRAKRRPNSPADPTRLSSPRSF